jgi:hypothetical protein
MQLKLVLILIPLLWSSGCKSTPKLAPPSWAVLTNDYSTDQDESSVDSLVLLDSKAVFPDCKVDLVGLDLSWSSAVRDICGQCSLSVVIPQDMGSVPCDLQLNDVPIEDALTLLCSLGDKVSFNLLGDTITFSENTMQSVGIVEPYFADIDELSNVIASVLPKDSAIRIANGMIVIGGTELSVAQSKLVSELVATKKPRSWFVDVAILSMSDNWQVGLGIDGSIGGVVKSSTSNKGVLDYVLDGTWSIDYGLGIDQVILRTGIIVLEGTESTITSTDEIPIPQRTVSPEGTVTISGYTTVSAGIVLSIKAVAVPDGLRVDINPSISDVTGFVSEKPIVSKKSISSTVIVKENDKIILSGLWSDRVSRNIGSLLTLGASESSTEWLVCARFRRLSY